jgi:hypothetical protein
VETIFPTEPADLGIIHAVRSQCGRHMLFYHPARFAGGSWTYDLEGDGPLHFFSFRVDSIPELDRLGDFAAWAPDHLTHVGPR